jgi:hypothetical protein
MGRLRMVHGKSESRRTIAGWTKLSAVLYRRDWNAEFLRNRQIFVTQGSHLREDRQQLDALFGQLDALLLVGGVVRAGDDALVKQCL